MYNIILMQRRNPMFSFCPIDSLTAQTGAMTVTAPQEAPLQHPYLASLKVALLDTDALPVVPLLELIAGYMDLPEITTLFWKCFGSEYEANPTVRSKIRREGCYWGSHVTHIDLSRTDLYLNSKPTNPQAAADQVYKTCITYFPRVTVITLPLTIHPVDRETPLKTLEIFAARLKEYALTTQPSPLRTWDAIANTTTPDLPLHSIGYNPHLSELDPDPSGIRPPPIAFRMRSQTDPTFW